MKNLLVIALVLFSLSTSLLAAGPININTASAKEIAKELNGIGIKKAEQIVQYRDKNGAFKSAKELMKIKGIGEKTISRNEALIRFK